MNIIDRDEIANILAPLDVKIEKPIRTDHVIGFNKYNSDGAFHRIRILRDTMNDMKVRLNENSRGISPAVRDEYDELFDKMKQIVDQELECIKYGD